MKGDEGMRDILFRGYTGSKWLYGNILRMYDLKTGALRVYMWDSYTGTPVEVECVHQFTGMYYMGTGGKIYEGDIIHLGDPDIKYIVCWVNCGFEVCQIDSNVSVGLAEVIDDMVYAGNVIEGSVV